MAQTLKERLDAFGWDKLQQGQLPPGVVPQPDNFVRGQHQYDLYALNVVCVVVEDRRQIVEFCGIGKSVHGGL